MIRRVASILERVFCPYQAAQRKRLTPILADAAEQFGCGEAFHSEARLDRYLADVPPMAQTHGRGFGLDPLRTDREPGGRAFGT